MKNKILLLGNGGHCKSVMDSLIELNLYDEIGIIERQGASTEEEFVIGTDDELLQFYKSGWADAIITVGSIGDTTIREKIYYRLKEIGFNLPSIIDKSAVVSARTQIDEGVYIGKRAVVNSGAVIDKCAIINTGAIVEHDCRIGQFVHISPGAVLCGGVFVGNCSHIGASSVIKQQVIVEAKSLIGAGSVVVNNIPQGVIAYGNPCVVIKENV